MLSVLSNVLRKKHRFEGCELDVRRYYECMGVVPSDHNPNVVSVPSTKKKGSKKDVGEAIERLSNMKLQPWKQISPPVVMEEVGMIEVTWTGASSSNVNEDLYLCFENKRVSGGGPIEKLTIDEQECVAIIKFATPSGKSSYPIL